ncbi:hypothetical protein Trydic_g7056 [Trypoxylus dichotomus]
MNAAARDDVIDAILNVLLALLAKADARHRCSRQLGSMKLLRGTPFHYLYDEVRRRSIAMHAGGGVTVVLLSRVKAKLRGIPKVVSNDK